MPHCRARDQRLLRSPAWLTRGVRSWYPPMALLNARTIHEYLLEWQFSYLGYPGATGPDLEITYSLHPWDLSFASKREGLGGAHHVGKIYEYIL